MFLGIIYVGYGNYSIRASQLLSYIRWRLYT